MPPENHSTIQSLPEFFNSIIIRNQNELYFSQKKNYGSSRTVTEVKGKPFKVSNKITILLAKHGMFNLISTCVTVNPQLNDHAMCFENIPIYWALIQYVFWVACMKQNEVNYDLFFKLKHRYFGALEINSTIQNLPEFFNSIINGTRKSCIFSKNMALLAQSLNSKENRSK